MPYDNELELMAALQGIPLEQAQILARSRRAQGLMATPIPQGQQIGRVYKAGSPLEHLAAALVRGFGARDASAAERDLGGLAERANAAGMAQAQVQREPAPPEWGAPKGLTRKEALGLGSTLFKPQDPDNLPAPPEWNPLPGMTRGQAISAGYAKKPAPLKTPDPDEGPPSSAQVEGLRKYGIDPRLVRTRAEATRFLLQATNPRAAAAAEKRSEDKAGGRFLGPDFEFAEDVPPNAVPDSIRAKLMDEAGLVNHVSDTADRIRALLKQHGTEVYGKAATEMSTLVEDLRLTLKDPVYNLGVLNGRDYELLSKVVADPTSLKDIAKQGSGLRDLDTAIATASRQWRTKVKQRMRGYGANPRKGGRYEESPDPLGIR